MKRRQLIAVLVTLMFFGCKISEQPEFKEMQNVKFSGFNVLNKSVEFSGNAVFSNPNDFGFAVSGIELDVYVNDVLVSHISQESNSKMQAKSDFSLLLVFDLSLKNINKDFGSMLGNLLKKPTIQYRMDGHLVGGLESYGIKVPISYADSVLLR